MIQVLRNLLCTASNKYFEAIIDDPKNLYEEKCPFCGQKELIFNNN